jgi:hypothetical protein
MPDLILMPLHVLLLVMRRKWDEGDEDGAVALAKIAAPYLHPRVPAARPVGDLAGVSDDELDRFERRGGADSERASPSEFPRLGHAGTGTAGSGSGDAS